MDRLNSRAVKQTGKWELSCFLFVFWPLQSNHKKAGWTQLGVCTKDKNKTNKDWFEWWFMQSYFSNVQEQKYRAGSEFNTVSTTQITWVFKTLTFCWVCYGEDVCRFILKYWWCQGQTQSNINKVKRYSSSFWVELLTKPWFVLLCKKNKNKKTFNMYLWMSKINVLKLYLYWSTI